MSHLQTIYEAVWQDRRIRIRWRAPFGSSIPLDQVVDPYGLVAKDDAWHVVCAYEVPGHARRVRGRQVSSLLDVQILDERFERLADFDLAAFWQSWCAELEAGRPTYPVQACVAPHLIPELPRIFGEPMREQIDRAGPSDAEGWITVDLPFASLWVARERLLGFGGAVEVLAPEPLRLSLIDYAQQILKRYGTAPSR